VTPENPHTPFSEYEKHVLFLANLDCFEKMEFFPVWFKVEDKLRKAI
jgi:hypothetical protein